MIGLDGPLGTLDGVQLGMNFPSTALMGDHPTLATRDLSGLQVPGLGGNATGRYQSLATAWGSDDGRLPPGAREAVALSKGPGAQLGGMGQTSTTYPTGTNAVPFAEPLKNAAKLIRADLGTDVIAIDAGNWDFHTGYGSPQAGGMQSNISGLAQALAAFMTDLGALRSRVTVITISEFGRRVTENGSRGFDHGWGNMMLVAGAGVRGGQYYGNWPGLDAASLRDGDLKVTTDYRNVLADVVGKRFPDRSVAALFPQLVRSPVGIMR